MAEFNAAKGPLKYYAVWKIPALFDLGRGIYCCKWETLRLVLPGQKLLGSGVSSAGFSSLESAVSHFCTASSPEVLDRKSVTVLLEFEIVDAAITPS